MTGLLKAVRAFLVRDFQVESSYRLAFLLQLGGLFFTSMFWYYIAQFLGGSRVTAATGGVPYYPYVIAGMMVARFQEVSLSAYAAQIRQEQTTGTLEAMLVTPARLPHLMLASTSWSYMLAGIQSGLFLVFAVFVFGVQLDIGSPLAALAAVILTAASISGIGVLSAAFVLYFKRGNPINFFISSSSVLLGDVVFPSETLPSWLAWFSKLIPIRYATDAVRGALLRGEGFAELMPNLAALSLFTVILLPIGLLGARYAVRKAKQEGSLVQY